MSSDKDLQPIKDAGTAAGSSPDADRRTIWATVEARALHALLQGWEALSTREAERLASTMAERFWQGPRAAFADESGRGFYATLAEDEELAESFSLLVLAQADIVAASSREPLPAQSGWASQLGDAVRRLGREVAAVGAAAGGWFDAFLQPGQLQPLLEPVVLTSGEEATGGADTPTLFDIPELPEVVIEARGAGSGTYVDLLQGPALREPLRGWSVLVSVRGAAPVEAVTDTAGRANLPGVSVDDLPLARVQVRPPTAPSHPTREAE